MTKMRPDFLVIGAMKAGTTSLSHYLGSHPEIYVTPDKELHFFSRNWSNGIHWYERHFDAIGDARIAGEASPTYTAYPQYDAVAERIATVVPDARLVYLIREPIARMRSHYAHRRLRGREHRPIREALLEDPNYLAESNYALQLEQYLSHFAADRILVIDSASLRTARGETMRRAFLFLGVSTDWESDELADERNVTADGHPRSAVKRFHQLPGYSAARAVARAVLGDRAATRLAYRTVDPAELAIPGDVEDELRGRLASDQERLDRLLPQLGPKGKA